MDLLIGIRSAGNYFYERGRFIEARRKYRKAERYYNYLYNGAENLERCSEFEADDRQQMDAFMLNNCTNMAAVELKLENYENAKYCCNEAIRLNPKCSKAYYRRGQAHTNLNDYESAIDDLKVALKLVPDNKQILNELAHVQQLQFKYNRSQMNSLKNLFSSN